MPGPGRRCCQGTLDGVAGWRVVEPADESAAITTLAPPAGVVPATVRARLIERAPDRDHRSRIARAPFELTGPVLVSPHVDVTAEDLEALAVALRTRRSCRTGLVYNMFSPLPASAEGSGMQRWWMRWPSELRWGGRGGSAIGGDRRVRGPSPRGDERADWAADGWDAASVEVAAALGISLGRASNQMDLRLALRTRLPKVAALLCDGVISLQIARTAVTRTSLIVDRDALEVVDSRIATAAAQWGSSRRRSWKRPWICGSTRWIRPRCRTRDRARRRDIRISDPDNDNQRRTDRDLGHAVEGRR